MPAARAREIVEGGCEARNRSAGIARARTPAALADALQRSAGNAAVARTLAPRLRLLRAPHRPSPVTPPGQGMSGLQEPYGAVFDRSKLTAGQKAAVSAYRAWMETTFSPDIDYDKSGWAREAASRAAAFPGDGAARAGAYAEMQNQIYQVSNFDWVVSVERGADGSYIFRGNPAREAQRIFVVDKSGRCYSGTAKEGLSGRGAGKTVNYEKLRPVAGPGPEPVKAPVGEPPLKPVPAGPEVEPVKPKGGGTPEVEPPVVTPEVVKPGAPEPPVRGPRGRVGGGGVAKSIGFQLLIMAVFWWFHRNDEEEYRKHLEHMMETKLTPAVDKALDANKETIDKLTTGSPSMPLYAVVQADYDTERTESGIGGTPSADALTDIRFSSMGFSPVIIQAQEKVKEEKSGAQVTNVWTTRRVTSSILIFDPEYEAQQRRLADEWDEIAKKDPLVGRIKPISGEAAKNLDKTKWSRRYREIQNFHVNQQLRYWRELKEKEREERRKREQERSRVIIIK
jgi:hypothetical protein